jgi:hypothetical protein
MEEERVLKQDNWYRRIGRKILVDHEEGGINRSLNRPSAQSLNWKRSKRLSLLGNGRISSLFSRAVAVEKNEQHFLISNVSTGNMLTNYSLAGPALGPSVNIILNSLNVKFVRTISGFPPPPMNLDAFLPLKKILIAPIHGRSRQNTLWM